MRSNSSRLLGNKTRAWVLFVVPAIVFVAVFSLYPLLNVVYLSFQKYNAASGSKITFTGFRNYINMMGSEQFLNSLKVTFIYTFIGVVSTMIFGILLALLLNRQGKMISVMRGIALMPMLICGAALTIAWMLLYNSNFGLFNIILEMLHMPPVNWLATPGITLYALAITDTWQCTPFVMILTLAGMQGISNEYYEAAAIDGANKIQIFFKITLPLLKNVLLMVLIMRIIDEVKVFEKPYLMANKGGPMNTTELITVYVYKQSFERWEYGVGATGSLIVAIMIAVLTLAIIKLSRVNTNA